MADSRQGVGLARIFWIVACGDIVVVLGLIVAVLVGRTSHYDALVVAFLLAVLVPMGAVMGVVALVRKPVAYGIGLVLMVMPPLFVGTRYLQDLVELATAPSAEALQAGHGYFSDPANRALADAVVAGDVGKVTALLPGANPNASGRDQMTMLRLAVQDGHGVPAIVGALVKAGADPDQDQQLLFGKITTASGDTGDMILNHNEPLLRAVLDAGVDLNHWDQIGYPRFFSGLKWADGLALMLAQGANIEAEDKDGNTAIMWAVWLRYWPAIDVLLARGARLDHVNHGGKSVRDAVQETVERHHDAVPPQLATLAARLR